MKFIIGFLFWYGVTYIVCMSVYWLGLKLITRQNKREQSTTGN